MLQEENQRCREQETGMNGDLEEENNRFHIP
jgi:hypothetical protein